MYATTIACTPQFDDVARRKYNVSVMFFQNILLNSQCISGGAEPTY